MSTFVAEYLWEASPMYIRLAFWTLSLAYTSALFSRTIPGSSPGILLTAALFGAVFGFSLGGMLINRRTRRRV
jgi:hypothetical protein